MLKVVVLEEKDNSERLIRELKEMNISSVRCNTEEEINVFYNDNAHDVIIIKKNHFEVVDKIIDKDPLKRELSIIDSKDVEDYVLNSTNLTDYVLSEIGYIRSMENEKKLVYKN